MMIQTKLKDVLHDIGEFNYDSLPLNEGSLFDGYCGLSLFYYQLYCHTSNEKYYILAQTYFEKGLACTPADNLNLSFGMCGPMWLLHYYVTTSAFDIPDANTYLESFDRTLESRIDSYRNNTDAMHGLLSIANYLFWRNTVTAYKHLHRILDILYENGIETGAGLAWKGIEHYDINHEEQYFSFGYAHGLPAILYFLSLFVERGIQTEKAALMLKKGLAFLFSYENRNKPTWFPTHLMKNKTLRSERVAFCYGDLGIACGLTAISTRIKDASLKAKAASIGENIAALSISRFTEVNDIGLCHGAAGNGLMFHLLHQSHGSDIFRQAALQQYEQLLNLRQTGTGITGFTSLDYDKEKESYYRKTDSGFINGTAGVGLSIINYLNNENTAGWESILYLR